MTVGEGERDLGGLIEFAQNIGEFAQNTGELAQQLPGVRAAYEGFCRIAAGTPGQAALDLVNVGTVCTPYLDDLGRTFGGEGVPFSGGQCDNTRYTINYTIESRNLNNNNIFDTNTSTVAFGPIVSFVIGSDSRTTVLTARQGPGFDVEETIVDSAAAIFEYLSITINSVVPDVGQPNNCGDPAPVYMPGDGWEGEDFGSPITITDPNGNGDFEVVVGPPTDDGRGGISIPVDVGGIEINIGPGNSGGPDSPVDLGPTGTGQDIPGNAGDPPQVLPDPPAGSKWVAIALIVTGIPPAFGQINGTNPNNRYFSPLGNFTLRFETDSGEVFWGDDVIIQNSRQLLAIPCEGLCVNGFRVNLLPGLSFTATPIFRTEQNEVEQS